MNTYHLEHERSRRRRFIQSIGGLGDVVDTFEIDNGHRCGAELHCVTSNAIVVVVNKKTNKAITELIARPAQLRKLYNSVGKSPPNRLLKLAYKHNIDRYNYR